MLKRFLFRLLAVTALVPTVGMLALPGPASAATVPQYTIEQAISDQAQRNTIAFDALGFWTGDFNADTFFPPGKVADYFGFQYLRDNDPSQMGHSGDFLTRAAFDTLNVLTSTQRTTLITLARSQVADINSYATKRFVLISAFRRYLAGTLPPGTTTLSESAVTSYSSQLYAIDSKLTLARAKTYGSIIVKLTSAQRTKLNTMVGQGMTSWPVTAEPIELRGLTPDVKQAVMTYASDIFSWYAGSVTTDTYFCPERHGTYFGSFYLKDAPMMGNPGQSIDPALTGSMGATLLSKLNATQAAAITGIVATQKASLQQTVTTRQAIATELRRYLVAGKSASATTVGSLMSTYGQLDGEISWQYASAFVGVGRTLTEAQRVTLADLRTQLLGSLSTAASAYLYSTPIPTPIIPSTDSFFR